MSEVLKQHREIQYAKLKYFYITERCDRVPALWLVRLRETPWLVDAQGNPARPKELWSYSLQEVLGPDMRYLHPDIPLGKQKYRELAELLGVRLSADVDDVLHYLRELADRGDRDANKVQPIYRWLAKQNKKEMEKVAREFSNLPLILLPQEGWFHTDEVCWYDPSGSVPHLGPVWGKYDDLKSFFVQVLGVSEDPQPGHLVKRLLQLARQKQHPDIEQVRRIAELLLKQWDQLEDKDKHRLRTERCWPGRDTEGEFYWYEAPNLVIPDKERLVNLFQNKFSWWSLSWWALDGLEELAERLEIPRVSTATAHIKHEGQEIPILARDISTLHRIWPLLIEFANRAGNQHLSAEFPAVKRVEQIYVYYEIKGIRSTPDTGEAHFDRDNWHLYLTPDALESSADPVGDALERALEVPGLREFTKDVWEALASKSRLQKILQRWERRIQVALADLHTFVKVKDDHRNLSEQPQPSSDSIMPPGRNRPGQIDITDDGHTRPTVEESQRPIAGKGHRQDESIRAERQAMADHQFDIVTPYVKSSSQYRRRRGGVNVEKYAMEKAMKWWQQRGYQVEDVSELNLGYDITVEKGEEKFVVEVKGLSSPHEIEMTENEWKKAQDYGPLYWLMVVVLSSDEIIPVQDPVRNVRAERIERLQVVSRVVYKVGYEYIIGAGGQHGY